jgi:hypothetical protein
MQLTDQQQAAIRDGARLIATVMDPQPTPYLFDGLPETDMPISWTGAKPFTNASPVPDFPSLTFGESRAVRSGDVSDLDLLVRLRIEFTYVGNDQKQLRRRMFDSMTNNAEWLWLTDIRYYRERR